jgi:hypothetical protein
MLQRENNTGFVPVCSQSFPGIKDENNQMKCRWNRKKIGRHFTKETRWTSCWRLRSDTPHVRNWTWWLISQRGSPRTNAHTITCDHQGCVAITGRLLVILLLLTIAPFDPAVYTKEEDARIAIRHESGTRPRRSYNTVRFTIIRRSRRNTVRLISSDESIQCQPLIRHEIRP